jgi:hypothetical protein
MEVTRVVLVAKFEAIFPHLDERQRRPRAAQGGGHCSVARVQDRLPSITGGSSSHQL